MTCERCGAQSPEEANFCWRCGKLLKPEGGGEEEQIEICEIEFRNRRRRLGLRNAYEFAAIAVGPHGQRIVDTTGRISGRLFETMDIIYPALHALTERLEADGWQPLARGGPLGLQRFWRKVEHHKQGEPSE